MKRYYNRTTSWILANIAGWALAAAVLPLISYMMKIKVTGYANLLLAAANLLIILSGGVILGIVTSLFIKTLHQKG